MAISGIDDRRSARLILLLSAAPRANLRRFAACRSAEMTRDRAAVPDAMPRKRGQ